MIEIKFSGNSIENIIRQIVAFAEKVEVKEGGKKGGKKETAGGCDIFVGEKQRK